MRLRLPAAAAVAAALAALPAPASGIARDQIVDLVGDARGGQAYADITRARWSTTGTGANKALVASLTLAAQPRADLPFVYEMKSEVKGCGTVWFQYHPGHLLNEANRLNNPMIADGDMTASVWIECGDPGNGTTGSAVVYKQLRFAVKGNTMSWTVPLSALPDTIRPGVVFSGFNAIADVGEPTLGMSATALVDQSLDTGYGDGVWVMR